MIYKGTEVQVIPTTIPTINLPKIKKEMDPTKVNVIPKIAIASEIIIAPRLPNVRFTLAFNNLIKYKKHQQLHFQTCNQKEILLLLYHHNIFLLLLFIKT